MRLRGFQVTNYRSVEDSGWIKLFDRTALVGRNESGKTNVLLALSALNPPAGVEALNELKDFPRDRKLTDFDPKTEFIATEWELADGEMNELARLCPSFDGQRTARIGQRYDGTRWASFPGSTPRQVDKNVAEPHLKIAQRSLRSALAAADKDKVKPVADALAGLANQDAVVTQPTKWAKNIVGWIEELRRAATAASFEIPEKADDGLHELQDYAEDIRAEEGRQGKARDYVATNMPKIIYLHEYPELRGHQHLGELLERIEGKNEKTLDDADRNFMKLMKVAGLDPEELSQLLSEGAERRQLLTNRASATVTGKIRELWKDRELSVRFALDADHFDTLVSDPTAGYPVEVNLDERSRGFRWFFSFYITFAADTAGGPAADAVLLLDEPGLYLHATAQDDLLKLFRSDFDNQIVYTTHSPFMIPVDELQAIRTMNISQEAGTTVSNDPMGDRKTLFPLQAALGYNIAQTLFVGTRNIVIEGVTDFWYLSATSERLRESGRPGIPDGVTLTPVGGAQKVSYMVALLTAERLRVVVLLDSEKNSRATAEDLVKKKLIREENIVFAGSAFDPASREADIEDLLDADVYDALVQESYATELAGKTVALNNKIPRIVKRYEQAFSDLGLAFHKTRPARLFLQKVAADPDAILTASTRDRFGRLFGLLGDRLAKLAEAGREPFH